MKVTIGKFVRASQTVPVTFEGEGENEGRLHRRSVNAVLGANGMHDRKATTARVADVARGVEHKFALGLLGTIEQVEVE